MQNQRQIDRFRKLDDIRRQRDQDYTDNKADMYDSLINLILKHKMEIQKVPLASTLSTANEWAAKRGLRAGEDDLNKDGQPETVIYNKAGQPVIINGYRLKASDYPIRKAYYSAHPLREDRIDRPMREWVRDAAYDVRQDPNNPWKRTITNSAFGNQLEAWGYRMPTKPKKSFSNFSIFSKLIAPIVKEYLNSDACRHLFIRSEEAGAPCVDLFRKLVSPITLYRVLYMKIIERSYYFELLNLETISNYKEFKAYIKAQNSRFWSYFKSTWLNAAMTDFKAGYITPAIIGAQLVKDTCQWDLSDPDDVIPFLIGDKNLNHDNDFKPIYRNAEASAEFLEILKGPKSAERTRNAKLLEKWKKNARAAQKDWFKRMVGYMFEDEGAYERYAAQRARNWNPLTNGSEDAINEQQDHQVDVNTTENRTAPLEPAPRSPLLNAIRNAQQESDDEDIDGDDPEVLQRSIEELQNELRTPGLGADRVADINGQIAELQRRLAAVDTVI